MFKALKTVGRYIILMGRVFARPERMRMFFRQYVNELEQLGVNSIGIVLLISFFIGAVIHTDKVEHRESFHASMDSGICNPRNHAAGILLLHHVSDSGRKGRVKHRLGAGHHASHPADRRP